MNISTEFQVYCAYPWDVKSSRTAVALKELFARINGRIEHYHNRDNGPKINLSYNRLRSTSGTFVFNSIRQRISGADAIIFDITRFNPNVMIELGIALEMQLSNNSQCKVFLIVESKIFEPKLLPSDLSGYFLTNYWFDDGDDVVHFGDHGSLVMRIFNDALLKANVAFNENDIA